MFEVEGGFGGLAFWVGFPAWWFLSLSFAICFYLGFYAADLPILLLVFWWFWVICCGLSFGLRHGFG